MSLPQSNQGINLRTMSVRLLKGDSREWHRCAHDGVNDVDGHYENGVIKSLELPHYLRNAPGPLSICYSDPGAGANPLSAPTVILT